MNFISIEYAVFFAVAFVGWWALALLRPSFATLGGRLLPSWPRIVLLLCMSYGFYAAWNWRYLPLIFGSSTVDFFLARLIANETSPTRRKGLLTITVVLNLGFLGFFKYWNFGVENVHALYSLISGASLPPPSDALKVLLPPVGISFFTFESMSYVIDVYRGDLPAHRSYLRYLLFVSFFPHLVAGPIVRPRDLLPQLEATPSLSREAGAEGMLLIATGLVKKVVFADQLAIHLVDRVFERPENFSALEVLSGVYGYAIQIYCDFSGYTDIAIGSALLLGIRFPPNFAAPYTSTNIADFWRKWHISLSSWLRDYLYIPLGGNRGSNFNTYRNLMLTMVLGGLWHGASWTFVFWGFLHGLGLGVTRVVERYASRKDRSKPLENQRLLPKPLGIFLTFHYVCLAWIFFRAPTFGSAMRVIRQITTLTTFHPNLPSVVVALLVVGFLMHQLPRSFDVRVRDGFARLPAVAQGALLFAVAVLLHEAASVKAVPFVYFQF